MSSRVTVPDAVAPRDARSHLEQGRPTRRAALRPLLWRLHFISGFLIAPIVLSLALTGILFAWNPQIEALLYEDALTAVSNGPALPLAEQVRSAQDAHPGWTVSAVTPAAPGGEATTMVAMEPPSGASAEGFGHADGAVAVYVDPGSALVTGEILEENRPSNWLRDLHSSWRLGPNAEPFTEMAASWLLVSLLSGLYLWWPRTRQALRNSLRPRLRQPGRPRLHTLHTTLGVVVFASLLVLIGTGLTWTRFAGEWIDVAQNALNGSTPRLSTTLASGAGTGTGALTFVPTALAAPSEAGPGHEGHNPAAGALPAMATPATGTGSDLTAHIDGVAAAATGAGVGGVMKISPPEEAGEAWSVATRDSRWPLEKTKVAVNPETGQITDRVEWSDYPLMAKATSVGIAFHQAELFGPWNQVFLTLLAVSLVVMIVAGYRMWWLRRPAGSFGMPPQAGSLIRVAPVPLLIGFVVLMVLLPTLGVSFLVFLLIERLIRLFRGQPAAA